MTRLHDYGYLRRVMNRLPHANAFVIQFRSDADLETSPMGGRVEHVVSGRTATFESVQELPDLLRRMLSEARQAEQVPS
jgi:hypothetical protein